MGSSFLHPGIHLLFLHNLLKLGYSMVLVVVDQLDILVIYGEPVEIIYPFTKDYLCIL